MSEILQTLGITTAFDKFKADFSEISKFDQLYIDKVNFVPILNYRCRVDLYLYFQTFYSSNISVNPAKSRVYQYHTRLVCSLDILFLLYELKRPI